jgi:hypothetical protein
VLGIFYPNNNGSIYVAGIILYALTCSLGGFVSARLYTQMESPVISYASRSGTTTPSPSTSFNLFSSLFSSMSSRFTSSAPSAEKTYSPAEPSNPSSILTYDHTFSSSSSLHSPAMMHLNSQSRWQWNTVLVSSLFSLPLLLVFSFVNTTALAYGVTTAVPVSSVLWVTFLVIIGKKKNFFFFFFF